MWIEEKNRELASQQLLKNKKAENKYWRRDEFLYLYNKRLLSLVKHFAITFTKGTFCIASPMKNAFRTEHTLF